jgi:hypothetical protein
MRLIHDKADSIATWAEFARFLEVDGIMLHKSSAHAADVDLIWVMCRRLWRTAKDLPSDALLRVLGPYNDLKVKGITADELRAAFAVLFDSVAPSKASITPSRKLTDMLSSLEAGGVAAPVLKAVPGVHFTSVSSSHAGSPRGAQSLAPVSPDLSSFEQSVLARHAAKVADLLGQLEDLTGKQLRGFAPATVVANIARTEELLRVMLAQAQSDVEPEFSPAPGGLRTPAIRRGSLGPSNKAMVASIQKLTASVRKLGRKKHDSASDSDSSADDAIDAALEELDEDFPRALARGARCKVKDLFHPHLDIVTKPLSSYTLSKAKEALGLDFINKVTLRGHQTAIRWMEQLKLLESAHVNSRNELRYNCLQLDHLMAIPEVVALALSLSTSVLEDLGRRLLMLYGVVVLGHKWDRVLSLMPDEARLPGTFNSVSELKILKELNRIAKIEGRVVASGGKA